MATTGRSRGPASRPPRRPSAARPAARGGSGTGTTGPATKGNGTAARGSSTGSGAKGTGKGGATSAAAGSGDGASVGAKPARRGPSATAAGRASTTGGPTTAKVVRRTGSGWRGRVGGAVTHRLARRGVVLLSIAFFLAVLLGSTVAAWFHQQTEIAALRDHVAAQEQDVADLRAEQERWTDPAYVEQQARQRLKFVKPGERSYTVLDPVPAGSDDVLADTDVVQPSSGLPWYETVWESARTADAPGARR